MKAALALITISTLHQGGVSILSGPGSGGHYGLRGMRERAELTGGKLTVWSAVDAGTEVDLRAPGGSAYTTERSSWLSRKFARKAKA